MCNMDNYIPDMYQKSIYHIDYDKLQDDGIKCLLFDLDNTCVPFKDKEPNKKLKELFETLKDMDFKVVIFSNATKKRITPFKNGLGIDCSASSKKPNTKKLLKILEVLGYLLKRKTYFRIEYAGGCIAFDVSFYAKAEIDDFQKQLRRAKDLAEETATIKTVAVETPVQAPTQNSVPDDLRKYADLLKEGLISQEEYDVVSFYACFD